MVTREEIQERVAAGREQLVERKDELKAKFAEGDRPEFVVDALGMSLVGAGVGTIVMGAIRRRGLMSYLIGAAFIVAGLGLVGGKAYGRRTAHISETEESVRAQLASLDPIARAQVLKDMAGEQIPSFVRRHATQE